MVLVPYCADVWRREEKIREGEKRREERKEERKERK